MDKTDPNPLLPRRPLYRPNRVTKPVTAVRQPESNTPVRQSNKANVRAAANYARENGKLQAQPCQRCGAVDVEMHHPDYSKPLEVEWLCKSCHTVVHHPIGSRFDKKAYQRELMRKRRAAAKAKDDG